MKKKRIFVAALGYLILLTACKPSTANEMINTVNDSSIEETAVSQTGYDSHNSEIQEPVTFVWEKPCFGENFIITLESGNMFQLCEGTLSSFIGTDVEDGSLFSTSITHETDEYYQTNSEA